MSQRRRCCSKGYQRRREESPRRSPRPHGWQEGRRRPRQEVEQEAPLGDRQEGGAGAVGQRLIVLATLSPLAHQESRSGGANSCQHASPRRAHFDNRVYGGELGGRRESAHYRTEE